MVSQLFIKKIKEKLLLQKKELLTKPSFGNEIDTDGDEADEIQGNVLIEINNQLNGRDNNKLRQIEDALRKITHKTYGICEDCEEKIPDKRLLVNPYVLTCIGCAEDREKEEKQKGR